MLDIKQLKQVRTIVSHASCADGTASALLLHDALPAASVTFVQYNTAEHRSLPASPNMLFCDMTPPRERIQEFVDAGAIVLDHHEGAEDLVARFGNRGMYSSEPGASGAVLAFREVWRQLCHPDARTAEEVLRFATTAGVRDTWQRQHILWHEACAQAAALRFWPTDMLLEDLRGYGWGEIWQRLEIGPILLAKDAERDTATLAEAHRFTVSGVRVVCFEGLHTSDIADRLQDEADLVMGWHYRVEGGRTEMVVSCRSRGRLSALEFAQAHGGGGHRQAAGFTMQVEYGDPNPYEHLEMLVREHYSRGEGPVKE